MHTDMTGPLFMPIHLLLDDVYQFFGDNNIDWIKERVRILSWFSPSSILELSQMTDIQEVKVVPPMTIILQMVAKDLRFIENLLSQWIKSMTNDLVTQNKLIDFADAVGKFRWKVESSLPSSPMINETANPKNENEKVSVH